MPVLSQAEISAISVLECLCVWGVGKRYTLKLGMALILISTLLLWSLKLQRRYLVLTLCQCMHKNVVLRKCSLSRFLSPRSGRFSVFSLILSSKVYRLPAVIELIDSLPCNLMPFLIWKKCSNIDGNT